MAAPAFKSAGTRANTSSSTLTVAIPAGVSADDLMIMQYLCQSTLTPNTPSGWTKLLGPVNTSGGTIYHCYVFTRISAGGEPANVSVTKNTGAGFLANGIISVYSGLDTANPVDVTATATTPTTGTALTSPSVTTTKSDTLLARFFWSLVTGNTTITPATGTERYDSWHGDFGLVLELSTLTQSAAGASGTSAATIASGSGAGGLAGTIAVAPIAPAAPPVAAFTGTPLTGTWPLNVTFTDSSTNTPISWAWTFGDGGTSTSQNPTHSYAAAGTYTVALTATNAAGSDAETKTGYVTVANPSGTLTKIKWGADLVVTDEGSGVILVDVDSGGAFAFFNG